MCMYISLHWNRGSVVEVWSSGSPRGSAAATHTLNGKRVALLCLHPPVSLPTPRKTVLPPAYSISHISIDADVGGRTFSCVWREWFYQVLGSYKAENEPNLCLDMYFFSSFRWVFENMFFKLGYLSPRVCLLGIFFTFIGIFLGIFLLFHLKNGCSERLSWIMVHLKKLFANLIVLNLSIIHK